MWSLWADVNKGFSRLFLWNQQRGSFRLWILPGRISLTSSNLLKRGGVEIHHWGGQNSSATGSLYGSFFSKWRRNSTVHAGRDDGLERTIWCHALDESDECDLGYLPCMSSKMGYTLKSRHQDARPSDPSAELCQFRPTNQPKGILIELRIYN